MLVLTRRIGEKIVIGDDICVTIVEVTGERVRVGVTAPRHVRVDRQEVHQRRMLEELQAAAEPEFADSY